MSNTNIKYRLWEKDLSTGFWDCSALLSWYGYITDKRALRLWTKTLNAYNIYRMGVEKSMEQAWYWDTVFFWNKTSKIHHIAVLTDKKYIDSDTYHIRIVDLSPDWMQHRWIQIYKGSYWFDWEQYLIHYSQWVLFSKRDSQKMAIINWKDLYTVYNKSNAPKRFEATVTTYIIPEKDDPTNINCWWASCKTTANGTVLKNELAWKIGACPMQYALGTKLSIEWHGEITCVDRGWLIVMKWDINTRDNISTMNRIDVFAGVGTSKINMSKSERIVSVL